MAWYSTDAMFLQVLRPYSNIANLKIWEYFLKEDLAHGPIYDIEVVAKEQKMEDEEEEAELAITQNTRRIVNGCYDNIEHVQPDACTYLLQVSFMISTICHSILLKYFMMLFSLVRKTILD